MRIAALALALSAVTTVPAVGLTACIGSSAPQGPDADPGPDTTGETFEVTFGPVAVPAGGENTQCVQKRLGNLDHKWIGKLHTRLEGVSHHLIVYRIAEGEERPEPFECAPFIDTLDPRKGTPLMVSQIRAESLDMPFGVALGIEADQLVRLEMHFVNPGDFDDTVSASAIFEVLPDAQFQAEAGFLFIGNPDIELPPGQALTLGPTWFPLPPELTDVKVFAMTGHTHHLGTDVRIEHAPAREGAGTPVYAYDRWDWEEPPMATFTPPLAMPAGAGFRFSCSWSNTTARSVGFGESAEDEMCFFWSYYYPSQGHKVCLHTDQFAGGLDVCCPGPDPICALILDQLGGP